MLSLIPTPIGNLRDITIRALDELKAADVIICEDTRQTKKLLDHYEIHAALFSFHEHSGEGKLHQILQLLKEDKKIAYVTDGGMPSISDPGFELVHAALKEGLPVEALPGPSAFVTALAVSGLAVDRFTFFGFLPPKSAARKRLFESLLEREETLIFYESPFRVEKTIAELAACFGDREAVIAREISKKFEEYLRGTLLELTAALEKRKIKGEMVILVSGHGRKKVLK